MVLLTGASGFLGQHLLRFLSSQGYVVRALWNNHAPSKELQELSGVTWKRCDLLDIYAVEEALQGVDEIYHCAAIVSFDPRRRNEIMHFNTESTANIVNYALGQDIRKMVYISSVAALGRAEVKDKAITEDAEWEESRENSAYGMSKYEAEMEVWRGIAEGLEAVILNPGIILGEGNWNMGSAQLMSVAYKEFPFYTEGINAWVDVQDLVKIALMLMQSTVVAERFIVSAGNIAYKDIFTMMANALSKKPPRIKAGSFLTGLAWRWTSIKSKMTGQNAVLTKETARNAGNKCYYDNSRLLKAFPAYIYTPVEQTISRMATSFLKNIAEKN